MSTISVFAGQDPLEAPNDPLVSSDDFIEWFSLGVPDAAALARIDTALEIASADIRSETQQQLTVVSETITIYPPAARCVSQLVLPQWPVTAVSSFLIGTTTLTEGTDYVWTRNGIVTFLAPLHVWSYQNPVTVAYTHGWDPLPRDLAGVCLSRAKRLYDAPDEQQIEKEQLGDWSATYVAKTQGLTDSERYTLSRYASWTNGY